MELSDKAVRARPVNEASVPAHLLCKACSNLLLNCFQTLHGRRLCKNCKNRLDASEACTSECSEDERQLASQATCLPDTGTRREMAELMVHCPNAETGCEEQLKWKHVHAHLCEKCEFETVHCESCCQLVVQCKLDSSHRNLQSADCCPAFLAFKCPLCDDSSKWLNRAEFVKHQEICPARPMECKYKCVGCQEMVKRKELMEHYSCRTDEHLELVVKQLKIENSQKDEKIKELEARLCQLERQSSGSSANSVRQTDEKLAAILSKLGGQRVDQAVKGMERSDSSALEKIKQVQNSNEKLQKQLSLCNSDENINREQHRERQSGRILHSGSNRRLGHFRQRSLPAAKLLAIICDEEEVVQQSTDTAARTRIDSQQKTEASQSRGAGIEDVLRQQAALINDLKHRVQCLESGAADVSPPSKMGGRQTRRGGHLISESPRELNEAMKSSDKIFNNFYTKREDKAEDLTDGQQSITGLRLPQRNGRRESL